MLKKTQVMAIIFLLSFSFLASGCLSNLKGLLGGGRQQKVEEKKLNEFQGVGILEFKLKTGYSGNRINPGAQVFIVLSIRNNALGDKAQNVVASIENVDNIIDCQGNLWPPDVNRSSCLDRVTFEPDGCGDNDRGDCISDEDCKWVPACVGNNFYTLNPNLRINQQGIERIRPNEEVQFLYLTEVPSKEELRGISQEREIYYTVRYDYSKHMSYLVKAMSSSEFISRRQQKEEVDVSHQYSSTPGAIKLEPQLQEPLRYNMQGESPKYDLILNIKSMGGGLPAPNEEATLVLHFNDSNLEPIDPEQNDWVDVGRTNGLTSYETELSSSDIINEKQKLFEFEISQDHLKRLQNNKVPLTSFKFDFDLNYSYMKTGSKTLQVIPIE